MKSIIFMTLLCVLAVQANIFDFSKDWDDLKVTWNPLPLTPWGFKGMPRDLSQNNNGFEKRDDLCSGQKFVGQRYWNNKDPVLQLLYDNNGIIAGIQTSVSKAEFKPPASAQNKYYIEDGDYWTTTAYFVDPSTICGKGRSKDDLKTQGTGTGLWLQYGPNPITDSVQIPLNEDDVKNTKWNAKKCFKTMGMHYWFNVTDDMNCDDFAPNCILYNKGKLTAFCFAKNANLNNNRYDWPHPKNSVVKQFMNPVPKCFFSDPTFAVQSTIHVYFNGNPYFNSNC